MKYKAKDSYKKLSSDKNFMSLGMASKHIFLIEGLEITVSRTLTKELKDHLS